MQEMRWRKKTGIYEFISYDEIWEQFIYVTVQPCHRQKGEIEKVFAVTFPHKNL